jgi:tellurite methyltransferase
MTGDWNKVWHERGEERLRPDSWLIRALPLLPPGQVLDVACGRGRNALLMAEKGYAVTAVDASAEGLSQLAEEAGQRGLTIVTLRQDLEAEPDLPKEMFDVVLLFFYLQRTLIPALKQAVRPGGVAVVRTFSHAGPWAGGPGHPEYALEKGELPELFAGWEILLHEEGLEQSHRGGSLAGIVARRSGR